jgi:hypothetical protein
VTERNPSDPESFDERWQALADQLSQELGEDLAKPPGAGSGRIIHQPDPPELTPLNPDPTAGGANVDNDDAWLNPSGAPAPTPPGPRDWSEPEAADHFIPPDPPPIFDAQPVLVLGWVTFLGGLVAVLAWAIFRPALDVLVARFGLLSLVLGAGLLIWRMPHRRDPEDTSTGAQV